MQTTPTAQVVTSDDLEVALTEARIPFDRDDDCHGIVHPAARRAWKVSR